MLEHLPVGTPFRAKNKAPTLVGDLYCVLIDNNGNTVVQYNYDAWGNHKVVDASNNEITDTTHIGNLNPFRYRGYYYDCEIGLYFLKSRYYDPEVGRFLNMDSIEYADPETINGLNLYAYCGNNPIIAVDPYGNNFWVDVCNWFKNIGNSIKNWFNKVGNEIKNFVDNTFGVTVNHGASRTLDYSYYFLAESEVGVGYSKSFDTGKPVNIYVNLPEKWWRFWEFSVGIDVNINGWGAGIGFGGESSLSLHLGQNSLDIFTNQIGRLGIQWATQDEQGNYAYWKFAFNIPEIALTIAVAKYAPTVMPFLAPLIPSFGGI